MLIIGTEQARRRQGPDGAAPFAVPSRSALRTLATLLVSYAVPRWPLACSRAPLLHRGAKSGSCTKCLRVADCQLTAYNARKLWELRSKEMRELDVLRARPRLDIYLIHCRSALFEGFFAPGLRLRDRSLARQLKPVRRITNGHTSKNTTLLRSAQS